MVIPPNAEQPAPGAEEGGWHWVSSSHTTPWCLEAFGERILLSSAATYRPEGAMWPGNPMVCALRAAHACPLRHWTLGHTLGVLWNLTTGLPSGHTKAQQRQPFFGLWIHLTVDLIIQLMRSVTLETKA